jgi:hypothetical protein
MPLDDSAVSSPPAGGMAVSSPGASPSVLAGQGGPEPTGATTPGQGDGGLREAVQSIRDIQTQIMDLARQFPAAASSLRECSTGLRAAMRQIVANPGSPEPTPPTIGG